MSDPNEWVWLTHKELGDSPNPVLRSACHHWFRLGWSETARPEAPVPDEPAKPTDEDSEDFPVTDGVLVPSAPTTPGTDPAAAETRLTGSGTRDEKPKAPRLAVPARSESAATPAAPDENKE